MGRLDRAFAAFDKSTQSNIPEIAGEIGVTIGGNKRTEVPNRGQFVYVRLRSDLSELIEAFNDKVFPGYGLPVIVAWRNNRYEVIRRDTQRYPEWEADNPYLARHGSTHSLDKDGGNIGSDPVWVYPYQFMPSLVSPFNVNAVQNVYIHPQLINYKGTWKYTGNTGTPPLSGYRPTSGSSIILITLDGETGNPALFATTGSYIPQSVTGTVELSSYLPDIAMGRYIPLSFVVMQSGTTSVSWGNLYDARQFFTFGEDWNNLSNKPTEILEDLSSQIDGVSKHFTISHTALEKVEVYCNILQPLSSYAMDDDYGGFTLSYAPNLCDSLLVRYLYQ